MKVDAFDPLRPGEQLPLQLGEQLAIISHRDGSFWTLGRIEGILSRPNASSWLVLKLKGLFMEGAAEQAEEFRSAKIQSSSNSGHQISKHRAGNQNTARNRNCTPVLN